MSAITQFSKYVQIFGAAGLYICPLCNIFVVCVVYSFCVLYVCHMCFIFIVCVVYSVCVLCVCRMCCIFVVCVVCLLHCQTPVPSPDFSLGTRS